MKDQYRVVIDPQYGYRRLDPLPTAEEIESFYRDRYYDLVAAGGRAPDLRRFLQGGEEAQAGLAWLSQTLWKDIKDILGERVSRKAERWLLDIGCGPGHFARYMAEAGWHVVGVEPARDARKIAESFGFTVYASVEECLNRGMQRFDAVTFLNVLEHTSNPVSLLQSVISIMSVQAILVVRVPNDFSPLQESAQKKINQEPWWIAIPDHINYFNCESLEELLEKLGYQIVDILCDFPMELFLLFGDDYLGNPDVGSLCHKKRVSFELAIPAKLRRGIYRCFAKNGVGRDCLVFGRLALP